MSIEAGRRGGSTSSGGRFQVPRFARLFAVLAWALATVFAGSVAWWAVAAIGGEQGAARATVLTQSQVVALAGQAPEPRGIATSPGAPGTVPRPGSTSAPQPAPTPLPPVPQASAGEPPVVAPPPAAAPAAPPAAPPARPPAAAPAPAQVVRTWTVAGGMVSAQCRATQIELLYATPRDGWTVEVSNGGPEELEVTFRRGEDEIGVNARCVAGVPEMSAPDEGD